MSTNSWQVVVVVVVVFAAAAAAAMPLKGSYQKIFPLKDTP